MAVRQYVGARYVPKFYEGVDGSTEWVSGVAYEPLTIVTYLNNSFTSKIPVPACVGAPNVNPEYWANTGNYNAQIEQYRVEVEKNSQEVEQYRQEVVGLNEKVIGLENTTNNIYKHNVIYIGDSYAEGYTPDGNVTPWTTYCNNVLGSLLGEQVVLDF